MKNNKFKIGLIVLGLLVLAGSVLGAGKVWKEKNELEAQLEAIKKDPQAIAKEETKQLVDAVSKLVVLPEGDPVVATVTDKEKLKDQPIFAKAENGDKILIYTNAQKAYIYSPSKNKIVDVVPVNLGETALSMTGVSAENPLKLVIFNGSTTVGVTNVLEKRITEKKIVGLQVVTKGNAVKNDYVKTIVIDLTGGFGDQAKQLASMLSGEVGSLPDGESKPEADVLVIIGSDFK